MAQAAPHTRSHAFLPFDLLGGGEVTLLTRCFGGDSARRAAFIGGDDVTVLTACTPGVERGWVGERGCGMWMCWWPQFDRRRLALKVWTLSLKLPVLVAPRKAGVSLFVRVRSMKVGEVGRGRCGEPGR